MKILNHQSAQTAAKVVSIANCLWLPFMHSAICMTYN